MNIENDNVKKLEIISYQRRLDILDMIYHAKTGHTGGSLSSVDMIVALYYSAMHIRPSEPGWEERDRFILSKGHSVEGYYAVLADLGFFPKEELNKFSKYQSRLIGYPTRKVPGIEMNTGALGHGLPVAVGIAISSKMKNQGNYVYVLMGDGEQGEGSIYEAAMAAGHYRLDNLIAIIDRNRLQISGCTEDVMCLEPLADKWKSFRWHVLECNGNDIGEFLSTIEQAMSVKNQPKMIIANTTKGKGISYMGNNPKWHHGVMYLIFYIGDRQPSVKNAPLQEGKRYRAEVLDVWNMTITPLDGTFEGDCEIPLPGLPYQAIRLFAVD